ncbi:hypothetical protein PXK47_21440 [Phaeobacter gallaeciensis]|nr:hypothetical protein [Phaeobacter gallaeciensis]
MKLLRDMADFSLVYIEEAFESVTGHRRRTFPSLREMWSGA